MQNLDSAIREHAYHLWIADGRQDGRADSYWLAAQREILSSSMNREVTFTPTPRVEHVEIETKYPAKKAKTIQPRNRKRQAA